MSDTSQTAAPRRQKATVLATLLAVASLLFFVVVPTDTASAAPNSKPALSVPVAGTTATGDEVTGVYKITRFVERNGDLFAKGTFVGTIESAGDDSKVKKAVTIPVAVTSGAAGGDVAAQQVSCDILNLQLGPLDLNLLGLRVELDQVNLDITAEQAPGNLLGNLLCAVAHLLDGPPALNAIIAQLLNAILGILG
jgi:hypothetical protein